MTTVRLGIGAAAILIWFYGFRTDNEALRWVAIAMLAAAFLLRFLPRR